MKASLRCGGSLLLALLTFAVTLPGVATAKDPEPPAPRGELASVKPRSGEEVVQDQLIVKYKENAGTSTQANVRREEGLEKKRDLDLTGAELDKVRGQSSEQAVRDLERRPDVEYATPDRKVYPTGYADEPQFGRLWGLNNTGQDINGSPGTADVDVNAREASNMTQGDPSLVVAVIDDGVDFTHPDLKDRAWKNPGESGSGKETNGVDDDGNGKVDDVNGWDFYDDDKTVHDANDHHGTHVAGTIAASMNGEGIVGVAPNVKIMALKFLGGPDGSGTLSDAIDAIGYAKREGAKISNNSWGYLGPPDPALEDALGASGELFVAAAGNGGANNDTDPNNSFYPASYDGPNVLSVAAIDNKGDLASFSNYGVNTVDISAPGVDILSSVPQISEAPGAALTSVGASGKAFTAGFGADEIGDGTDRASFMKKAFAAVGRGGDEPILLVDDDLNDPGYADVGPTLSEAVEAATGNAPEVIKVPRGADGPDRSQLEGKTVVWATGRAWFSEYGGRITKTTLTDADQQNLTDFLNGGGKLVLTGMDALWKIETSSFVTGTLGLNAQSDAPAKKAFDGSTGTAFDGESYDLNSSTANADYHDVLNPVGPAAVVQGVYPRVSWACLSGTSMATPHVTGTAALAASKNPSLLDDSAGLKQLLTESGKPLSNTAGKTATGSMIDAHAAVLAASFKPPPPANTPPTISAVKPTRPTRNPSPKISAKVTDAEENLLQSGITLIVDGRKAKATYDPETGSLSYSVKKKLEPGKHKVRMVAKDDAGLTATKSWSFKVIERK